MTSITMNVQIDDSLQSKLSNMAKSEDKPVSFLINAAVKSMIADGEYAMSQIEAGLADFKAGRVTPHEEVMRRGREIIEKARIKQTAP